MWRQWLLWSSVHVGRIRDSGRIKWYSVTAKLMLSRDFSFRTTTETRLHTSADKENSMMNGKKAQIRYYLKKVSIEGSYGLKYRVSQDEWTKRRESVPYVKLPRYNPKHLYPKLNGYGDNGQRSLKLWQLLHTYWLANTYWNWQKYVVSVMLISVLNIRVTCEWHKAIKFNYKSTRTTVAFVLRFPSNLRTPQLFVISQRSLHYDVS